MTKRTFSVAAIGLTLLAAQGCRSDLEPALQPQEMLTARTENFVLVDQNGFAHELYRLKDATAVVLVMQVNGDPASRSAAAVLAALAIEHPDVEFLMINSSPGVERAAIAQEADRQGLKLPVLHDRRQLVGESLGAGYSGEAFVIDPKTWSIAYHGPVIGPRSHGQPKGDLASVLTTIAAGQPLGVVQRPGHGSEIPFPERSASTHSSAISYAEEIAPLLKAKCVDCHSDGGIGPFALSSYGAVKQFAPMIREAIRTNRMPPWQADPTVGKFLHDKSLSDQQAKTLVHWIEAGAMRGGGADPLLATIDAEDGWPLGKPDLVLDIPAFTIPASGIVDYQRPFTINPLREGKWLKASSFNVDQRRGIHHILTGLVATPPAGSEAPESLWGQTVGGYAVGAESTVMPENLGTYVPPGGAIGFQMHYTPFGRAATDRSQVALYFYKDDEQPDLVMRHAVIVDRTITIPPNAKMHKELAYLEIPKDALLYSVFPHAHYRGAYSDMTLIKPTGEKELLLSLPRYDFNWQRHYEFAEPVLIPAGSKLVATYYYDNSARNPANPDPSRQVPWGDQSFDEMLFTTIRYRWLDETSRKMTNNDEVMDRTRLMGMLDDNLDGRIALGEVRGGLSTMLKPNFGRVDLNSDGFIDRDELERVIDTLPALTRRKAAAAGP